MFENVPLNMLYFKWKGKDRNFSNRSCYNFTEWNEV